jgi:hypothetical protein
LISSSFSITDTIDTFPPPPLAPAAPPSACACGCGAGFGLAFLCRRRRSCATT